MIELYELIRNLRTLEIKYYLTLIGVSIVCVLFMYAYLEIGAWEYLVSFLLACAYWLTMIYLINTRLKNTVIIIENMSNGIRVFPYKGIIRVFEMPYYERVKIKSDEKSIEYREKIKTTGTTYYITAKTQELYESIQS